MHGRYYAFRVRGVNSAATAGAWSTSGQTYTNSKTEQLPANYPLVPSGVGPGDSFRLVYVTADTTRADSRYSQPYSDFVITSIETIFNNGELLGNLYVPFSQSPLVSTPGVSAQLTTDTTWTSADKGVPIYWLNGNKVADDYEDFYDGSWDDEANPKNDLGNDIAIAAANQPWTGSSSGGAELVESGGTWAAEAGGKALRFRVVGKLKSDETPPTVTSGSVAATPSTPGRRSMSSTRIPPAAATPWPSRTRQATRPPPSPSRSSTARPSNDLPSRTRPPVSPRPRRAVTGST